MFVVRPPSIIGTPRLLARDLNWRVRKYPNPRRPDRMYTYIRDFFTMPVHPQHVRGCTPEYVETFNFLTRNKYGQRNALQTTNIPTPHTAQDPHNAGILGSERFVVRPLRHSGGRDYRVTDNRLDFVAGTEYISELYPKRREYRIIFVFGQPLIYLRKKPNEGVSEQEPWGHANSVFQTINDPANCRLVGTDCVHRLSAFPVIRGAHIVAADILYNPKHTQPYVVLELNACPALTIGENRDRIVQAIKARHV